MENEPVLPMILIGPYCPVCGLAAMFERCLDGEAVPVVDRIWTVTCPCGWRGKSPRYTRLNLDPHLLVVLGLS